MLMKTFGARRLGGSGLVLENICYVQIKFDKTVWWLETCAAHDAYEKLMRNRIQRLMSNWFITVGCSPAYPLDSTPEMMQWMVIDQDNDDDDHDNYDDDYDDDDDD